MQSEQVMWQQFPCLDYEPINASLSNMSKACIADTDTCRILNTCDNVMGRRRKRHSAGGSSPNTLGDFSLHEPHRFEVKIHNWLWWIGSYPLEAFEMLPQAKWLPTEPTRGLILSFTFSCWIAKIGRLSYVHHAYWQSDVAGHPPRLTSTFDQTALSKHLHVLLVMTLSANERHFLIWQGTMLCREATTSSLCLFTPKGRKSKSLFTRTNLGPWNSRIF